MNVLTSVVLALGLMAGPALAQNEMPPGPSQTAERAPAPAPNAPARGAELTRSDVEALSDGLIPLGLAQGNIAGAVVVVVKDGKVLFEKGYGVSDTKTRAPVDPERTLFRPGSVSKLFTWTAVMQLVAQHKIDLDADVNTYLDFQIPETFGKPLTMRNLMTHTPGFQETLRPLLIGNPNSVPPLGLLLKQELPPQIYPPGEVPAYSNYGAALAGHIVERVSGEEFTAYVQHHILAPLGMVHATFVQPLPANLRADMSKGYTNAAADPSPFEMISAAPAGGLSASGADIARFMIAHLNNGELNGQRILPADIAIRMHGVASRPFTALSPMAYGFYHDDQNGHVVIEHGGDTGVFHSELELVLDGHAGFFLSMNSAGDGRAVGVLRRGFSKAFMDRYFPAPRTTPLPTLATQRADGAKLAGGYVESRRGDSAFTRLIVLFEPITVSQNADGTIVIPLLTDAAGTPKHWREIKPLLWQEVNGASLVQVKLKDGAVDQIGMDDVGPIVVLQPANAVEGAFNLYLLIATIAMLALTVLFWPIKAVLRWRYDRPMQLVGRARTLYRLTRAVALVDLVFLAGFPVALSMAASTLESHTSALDGWWRLFQLVGLVGVVGTLVPLAEVAAAVRDPARPWWTKASDVLIALAALATVWFAFSQHLITVRLQY